MKNFLFLASVLGLLTNFPVHAGDDLDDPCPNVYSKKAPTREELVALVERHAPTTKSYRVLSMLRELNHRNARNPRYFYEYREDLKEWRTETQVKSYVPTLSAIPNLFVKDEDELTQGEKEYAASAGSFVLVQYDLWCLYNQLFTVAIVDYGTPAHMIEDVFQKLDEPCNYTRVLDEGKKVTYRNLLEVAQKHTSQEPEWTIVNKYKDRFSRKQEKESDHITRDEYAELWTAVTGLSSKLKTKFGNKIPGFHIKDQNPASTWLERALEIIRKNADDDRATGQIAKIGVWDV